MEALNVGSTTCTNTPLSIGSAGLSNLRCLWRPLYNLTTSTPLRSKTSSSRLQQLTANNHCPLDDVSFCEPEASPIPSKLANGRSSLIGRDLSSLENQLNTSMIANSLENMDLSDNNNDDTTCNNELNKTVKISKDDPNLNEPVQRELDKSKTKKTPSKMNENVPKTYEAGKGKKVTDAANGVLKKKSSKIKRMIMFNSPEKVSTQNSEVKPGTSCNTTCTISQSSSIRAKSPNLHTAARAVAKQRREDTRKRKEQQLEEHNKKLLEEEKRAEKEEYKLIRQQTLFKAQPIRKYVPLPAKKRRALTEPVSPNIRKRRRVDSASSSSSSNSLPSSGNTQSR